MDQALLRVLFQDKSNQFSNLIAHHFITGPDAGNIATGIVLCPELLGKVFRKILEHLKPLVSINTRLQQVAEIVNFLQLPPSPNQPSFEKALNALLKKFDAA